MNFTERLRYFRTRQKYSVQEMADRLGISKRMYIRYEQEEPKFVIHILKRLCELGCDITWLITGKGFSDSYSPTFIQAYINYVIHKELNGIDRKLLKTLAQILEGLFIPSTEDPYKIAKKHISEAARSGYIDKDTAKELMKIVSNRDPVLKPSHIILLTIPDIYSML